QDCMAYRAQITLGVTRTMWKAEYVAEIDPLACTGCNLCRTRCFFAAIGFDRDNRKCRIDVAACYGCGVCRPVCQHGAIRLIDRVDVPVAAANW
ncbi:MAG: 4Fe-4S binding protein, partial [Desulfurivibrionaceae bacterium]